MTERKKRLDPKMIHETVIRDILDVFDDVKKSDELKGLRGKGQSFKSIAHVTSNLTLVFPVIVTTGMNIDNAAMVTKALERKCVSMLQMLFSAISISDTSNGVNYVKKFHNNLKLDDKITVDGFMDALDKFVVNNEGVNITNMEIYEEVKKDLKNISSYLPDNINETSLTDYSINKNFYGENTVILENPNVRLFGRATRQNGKTYIQSTRTTDEKNYSTTRKVSSDNDNYTQRNPSAKDIAQTMKSRQDILTNQLVPSDVKKANELVPTMMTINFISDESTENIPVQMLIGVKVKMYPVDSMDLMTRIASKHVDGNTLVKLIRSTTREISFTRDFLLAIDKAKIDALSQSRRGSSSKMWKILERRATKSKFRRHLGQINDASAITTIVITQEEVEYLKKNDNVNVEDLNVIRPILEAYNLMGFCVVDDSVEVAKFIFDTGNDMYESVSFNHLEREGTDGNMKKVLNLMTKMR